MVDQVFGNYLLILFEDTIATTSSMYSNEHSKKPMLPPAN
jgi:hypothetical protein